MTKNTLFISSLLLSACAVDYELSGDRPDVNPGDVTECPFSQIEGTNFLSYNCNPVFSSTNENWGGDVGSVGFYATDVMGHPFYQMWYTSSESDDFGNYGMGYAVSSDGTNWDTHPNNPLFESDPTSWDRDSISSQAIVWDPIESQYVMAYQGFTINGTWGMGIAKSKDGVSWERNKSKPAVDFGDFSTNLKPCWPLTITLNRGGFTGYIAASDPSEDVWDFDWNTWEETIDYAPCHIYSMASMDAENWFINESSPVFRAGSSTDTKGIASAAIVTLNNTLYMFYVGFKQWEEVDEDNDGVPDYISGRNDSLNLAISTDGGESWTRDANNPLPLSTSGVVSDVGAQVIGNRIHLWVTDVYDGKSAVGYFLYEPETGTAE